MVFQPGNDLHKLATQPKPFRDALWRHIKRAGDDYRKLDAVASKLFAVAEKGNIAAIKELADRLDGKVPQALVADDDGSPMILQVVRYVVAPTTPTDIPLTIEHDPSSADEEQSAAQSTISKG